MNDQNDIVRAYQTTCTESIIFNGGRMLNTLLNFNFQHDTIPDTRSNVKLIATQTTRRLSRSRFQWPNIKSLQKNQMHIIFYRVRQMLG